MELLVFGINHKSAPVAVRERWACSAHDTRRALGRYRTLAPQSEHVILSTCNRTEFYSCLPRLQSPIGTISDFEEQCCRLAEFYLQGLEDGAQRRAPSDPTHFYVHRQHDAVQHLFRVAGGLDSMIVGETEILGQLKSAYVAAGEAHATGPMFRRLFPEAIKVGKKVRTITGISRGCITPGQAALRLAEQALGDLDDASALLIGSGKIATITARSCIERGLRDFRVVNRTRRRAEELLGQIRGGAGLDPRDESIGSIREWGDLDAAITDADLVISSTGSDYPIITSEQIEVIQARRGHRPLAVVDLAIPRDFHPDVAKVEGVHLFNIDDLNRVIEKNIASRLDQVAKAEDIVQEQIIAFFGRMNFLQVDPVIRRLIERFESIRLGEMQSSVERFPEELHPLLDELTRRLVKKLLHFPIERLKAIRDMDGLSQHHVTFLKRLFLHDSPRDSGGEGCS